MTEDEFKALKVGDQIMHWSTGTVKVVSTQYDWNIDGTWAVELSNGGYAKIFDDILPQLVVVAPVKGDD